MKKSIAKNNTTAVILAAGRGVRMGEFTKDKPKVLVEVNNKTLLHYAIDFVKKIGITDIVVVGGYYFDKVKVEVERIDANIKIVENKDYHLQNLTSFAKALSLIKVSDLLVCNADYIFKDTTTQAVAGAMTDISVYSSFDLSGDDEDVMKTKTDSEGNLAEMSKQLTDFDSIYTGIFFFSAPHIAELTTVTAEILKNYDNNKTTVEYLFSEFMKKGYQVTVQDVGKADWIEIDTAKELIAVQKKFIHL